MKNSVKLSIWQQRAKRIIESNIKTSEFQLALESFCESMREKLKNGNDEKVEYDKSYPAIQKQLNLPDGCEEFFHKLTREGVKDFSLIKDRIRITVQTKGISVEVPDGVTREEFDDFIKRSWNTQVRPYISRQERIREVVFAKRDELIYTHHLGGMPPAFLAQQLYTETGESLTPEYIRKIIQRMEQKKGYGKLEWPQWADPDWDFENNQ
jgi:hypothetical protein